MSGLTNGIHVEDYWDGDSDWSDTLLEVAALTHSTYKNRHVIFPAGELTVTQEIPWMLDSTRIEGAGPAGTIIDFQPTAADKTCFKFSKGGGTPAIQSFCGLENIRFTSSGNVQDGKIAVSIEVMEEFWMRDFRISNWTSTSKNCVGVQSKGWQLNTIKNGHLFADIPLSLKINPSSTLDLDGNTFDNLILQAATTQPCVLFEDGIFVSSVAFKNCFLVGGTHGVYWNDTSSPGNSYGLSFENVRVEQRDDTTAYSFYFGRTGSPIEDVHFKNCRMDSLANGVFAQKIRKLTFDTTEFSTTTKEHINYVSEASMSIDFKNCLVGGGTSTATLTGFRQLWAGEKQTTAAPFPSTAHYAHDTQTAAVHQKMDDVFHMAYHGTLADDATFDLQCGSALGYIQAHVTVSMIGATKNEQMTCVVNTAVNAFKSAGTTNTDVTSPTVDGNLGCYRNGSTVLIKNRLGESVTYLVTVEATT
jgi:hypothetical protein